MARPPVSRISGLACVLAATASSWASGGVDAQRGAGSSGRAWPLLTPQASGATEVLQAIAALAPDVAWIGGHGGAILRTVDGGDRWVRVRAPAGDSLQFRDVHAFSASAAVVMSAGPGAASRVYRTDDGGASWTLGFLMDEPDGFLDCLDFWDDRRGFAYGDAVDGAAYVLTTEDGGRSWRRRLGEGTPAAREGEGGFAASGTCARAGARGRGWIGTGAGGSARVLRTTDYGRSWTAVEAPLARGASAGIFTLAADAQGPVMALGGDLGEGPASRPRNAAFTLDDGRSWTEAPMPAPLEGAVYGSAVGGPAGGERVVVAVSPAGAALTADMGARWREIDGLRAWAVEFAPGGAVGWASGEGGTIWRIEWAPGGRAR